MASNFGNIFQMPELRKRLGFTLALLAVYRIGVFIPVPGVNRTAMKEIVGGSGGILGLVNLFTGGALQLMSIFALGIMPYISASIIFQLMTVVVPAVERLQKDGEAGRKKITQYTRYVTVLLAMIQGVGISFYLENMHDANPEMGLLVVDGGWPFRLLTVVTLVTGTIFVMWLGEQITERGVGNGISLIITAGIIASFPGAVVQTIELFRNGSMTTFSLVALLLIALAVTGFIVFFESAQRRVPLQYAKRMVGRRMYGGQTHHLPLKVNMAGVIPPIFASSILIFPTTVAGYFDTNPVAVWIQSALIPGDWRYNLLYVVLNIFFCYFYTAVQVNPVDMADNLKKSDAFIPGIRPGKMTAEYLDEVMSRLTFAGALYISAVCVLPFFLQDSLGVSFYFGGTSLLIVVSVGLDTVNQIENYLITRQYDDFGAKAGGVGGRIKGRE